MSNELDAWFDSLPHKLRARVADKFRKAVDRHAERIRDAAPVGESGNTRRSVRVEQDGGPLQLAILAGGELTTKRVRTTSYRRPVEIGVGKDTSGIPRGGNAGVEYDYALGNEFGNSHVPARPWFYPTHRRHRDELAEDIRDELPGIIENL